MKKLLFIFISLTAYLMLFSCEGESANMQKNACAGEIIIPKTQSTGSEQKSFSDIAYTHPDTDALIRAFNETETTIRKNAVTFEKQLKMVKECELLYSDFTTMYTYTVIALAKNSADAFYSAEHKALAEAEASLMSAAEGMMVAAANSPHAMRFEKLHFGDGFVREYKDRKSYPATVLSLLEREARLEAEYSSISTSNVIITYSGITDSVENVRSYISNKYLFGSPQYESGMAECERLYNISRDSIAKELYIELLKVRRQIADELGYESYAEYAYQKLYHSYSPEDIDSFIDSVATYAVPVYAALKSEVFNPYFRSRGAPKVGRTDVLSMLYNVYLDMDDSLFDMYSLMLALGLFDVSSTADNRSNGAFTTYLHNYSAPFIFVTLTENQTDYMTLAHEFGHFADSYVNLGKQSSLELMELSSQGLELLTLCALNEELSDSDYRYLLYSEMENALLTMIIQGFYARFEQLAYMLPLDKISEETLTDITSLVAREMGLRADDLCAVLIDHIILYPFYVESYCPSIASALEIYFLEEESPGDGIKVYKELLLRHDEAEFEKKLIRAGLSSPFKKDFVKGISDKIYYSITKKCYSVPKAA